MTTQTFVRRAAGLTAATLLSLTAVACGDDDSSAQTDADAELSCTDRFVELFNSPEAIEAARNDGGEDDVSDELEDRLEAFEDDCDDALSELTPEEAQALLDRIDPVVLDMLGAGGSEDFEETGDTISGG